MKMAFIFASFFVFNHASFAQSQGAVLLVPANSIDFSTATTPSANDCSENSGVGAIVWEVPKQMNGKAINLSTLNRSVTVNGEKFVVADFIPPKDGVSPTLTTSENKLSLNGKTMDIPKGLTLSQSGDNYVVLSMGKVKFKYNNIKGSFDGDKVKFTIPLN